MRATGIVRRIDDLGRVVLPKEIRRVMRIREGDPLDMLGKSLHKELENAIQSRKVICARKGDKQFISILNQGESEYDMQIIQTIISEGDAVGAVILLTKEEDKAIGETEKKAAMIAAGFLGRQMEG